MRGADLFAWEAMRAAEQAVAAAHARQVQAQRRVLCAPHGTRREREAALRRATIAALSAEAALAEAREALRA